MIGFLNFWWYVGVVLFSLRFIVNLLNLPNEGKPLLFNGEIYMQNPVQGCVTNAFILFTLATVKYFLL